MRYLITLYWSARQRSSMAVICATEQVTTKIGIHLLQHASSTHRGIFRTARSRSRRRQRNTRVS